MYMCGYIYVQFATVTPQIKFELLTPVVEEGGMQTLTCTVTAQPVATFAEIVRFTSTGERMVVANDSNVAGDMEFRLRHPFTAQFPEDDGALFQCRAENANGPDSVNVTIMVQGELYMECLL